MGSLVEDLLLLARLDEGRPLETGPVEIGSLVDDIRLDTVVAHPNHRIEVSLVGSPEARTVMGDRHRLHQVLANVVGNAVRHTPVGTTVAVKVAPVAVAAGEDDQVEVVIRDDGPGMEPDLAARAFERFARGDLARSRAEGSTGLGLSIVAAIVAAHRGRVALESVPGEGTVVTVQLPRSVDGGQDPPAVEAIGDDPAEDDPEVAISGP